MNPQPFMTTVVPATVAAGSGAFTLDVVGSSFVNGSMVRWNGSDRTTMFVSSIQLRASIPATDLSTGGNVQITVFTPEPGGGTTAARSLAVTDIVVSSSPANATVSAGQTATYTLTVTPQFGPFGNAISLSCSGLPALSSCAFNPPTVTPGGTPINSTLTITTTAPSSGVVQPPTGIGHFRAIPNLWALALLLALPLVLVFCRRSIHNRRWAATGFLILVIAAVLLQASCAGGSSSAPPPAGQPRPGTPVGTFTVTVTGTSGSLQRTTTVTLTVN